MLQLSLLYLPDGPYSLERILCFLLQFPSLADCRELTSRNSYRNVVHLPCAKDPLQPQALSYGNKMRCVAQSRMLWNCSTVTVLTPGHNILEAMSNG